MYEGATGERFTLYSRRDQAPQSALRYRAAGPVGSVFWVEDEAAFVVSGRRTGAAAEGRRVGLRADRESSAADGRGERPHWRRGERAAVGRDVWEGAGPARAVTTEAFEAHRLYIAEVRHPIEVKAGESHLNRWLSRRVGYEMPTPNLDAFGLKLLGGRLLPGNAGRPALLYMYEGPTGERFTLYSRRDQAPQSALRYRAAGPVGSVFWAEDEAAYVVSGPADRARLQKVAESVYEQIENRPQQTGAVTRPHLAQR